jgi:dipeptidyl aminopeptidase/acylaminoacyl peptidase
LGQLVSVRAPVMAADGRSMLFQTTRQDFETNRNVAATVLLDVATRRQQVVFGEYPSARSFAFVAPGRVAFLATAGPVAQVFIGELATQRARQVTSSPSGVRAFAVSPDGRQVAYSADDLAPERTGPERFNDSFEIGNDDFLTMSPPRPAHLWVQEVDASVPRRLTSGSQSLATSLSTSRIEWTPDGASVVMQVFASPHAGDTDQSRIARVTVRSGQLVYLTDGRSRADNPQVSPDGQWVVFSAPRDGIPANQRELHVVAMAGGEARNVSRPLDRAVSSAFTPDRGMLWFGTDGTRDALWRADLSGRSTRLDLGDVVTIGSISVADDGSFAFLGGSRDRPEEVWLWPAGASAPHQLTSHNEFLASRRGATTIGVTWGSSDELTADGVVTYPPGFDRNRRYPLVLYIHGGPTASSTEGYSTRVHLLASRGWIVFQPNYRGSDNRGNAFQRAIADNPGPGIERDVLTGIAELVKRGGVDTTRIGVSGWSFGGYVSAWLIGQHSHWKAAIVGAGAMDLYDMYTLTDLNVQTRHAIAGSPYTSAERDAFFRKHSPLTYASQVRTPTLILHDVRDQRVTITQSFKLYHALKDNRVPVQFIAYPVAGHSPTDPVRARDVHRRWIDWFERQFATPVP